MSHLHSEKTRAMRYFTPVLAVLLLAAPGMGAPILDQSHLLYNNIHTVNSYCQNVYQTFTAGLPGWLDKVEVQVNKYTEFGVPQFDNLYMDIVTTDASGVPTSTVLGSASLPPSAIPGSGSIPPLTTFTFSPGVVPSVAGTKYAIRLSSPGTLANDNRYQWLFNAQPGSGGGSGPDAYLLGQMFRERGGNPIEAFAGDAVFQTYVVPEPATMSLFGLGACLALLRKRLRRRQG